MDTSVRGATSNVAIFGRKRRASEAGAEDAFVGGDVSGGASQLGLQRLAANVADDQKCSPDVRGSPRAVAAPQAASRGRPRSARPLSDPLIRRTIWLLGQEADVHEFSRDRCAATASAPHRTFDE
jgi:hypothetical protein